MVTTVRGIKNHLKTKRYEQSNVLPPNVNADHCEENKKSLKNLKEEQNNFLPPNANADHCAGK
jgi:hypothetical protein